MTKRRHRPSVSLMLALAMFAPEPPTSGSSMFDAIADFLSGRTADSAGDEPVDEADGPTGDDSDAPGHDGDA